MHCQMINGVVRNLNFFSPQRKALRDSAFRAKMEKFKKVKARILEQKQLASAATPYTSGEEDIATKYSNEESLRKNPRLRKMIHRPTAALPRTHLLFIKNGSVPLSLEDLSVPGKSIFDESKIPKSLLGTSKASKEDPESWLLENQTKKGHKPVEWQQHVKSLAESTGISDIVSGPTKTDPALLAKKILGPRDSESLVRIEQDTSLTSVATNLISTLRDKAVAFSQTGINPDLLESLETALSRSPGLERQARRDELENCSYTVSSLVESGKASTENFNLLIRALGHQAVVKKSPQLRDEAFKVCTEMTQLGFEPDQDTFVSLIIAAGRNAELARYAYLEMRKNLISPSEKVYGSLIKAHVKSGDLGAGFALLRKMQDEGLTPNQVVYTTLIDGLVKAGKTELAWGQFYDCRTWKNIKPDSVLFSVMIKACTRKEECERALGILDDLRASNEFPTDITYTHLIECMSMRADFSPKAFEFWNQMQLEGFPMNTIVAKSLVRACAKTGDLNRLRKSVSEISANGIPLTPQIYALSVETCGSALTGASTHHERTVNLRLAWHIVADMRAKGMAVTAPVLDALVVVYKQANLPDQATAMLQQYTLFECEPSVRAYETLLEMFGLSGSAADQAKFFKLYDSLKDRKLSDRIYHLALDVAMESKSSKRTVAMLEQMNERKIWPLPAAMEKLAVVGRKIIHIHQVVGKMVATQREEVYERSEREKSLLTLAIEEHRTRLAALEGKTDTEFVTVEHEVRQKLFSSSSKGNMKLSKKEHLQVKKKGGEMHARRVDKPRAPVYLDSH